MSAAYLYDAVRTPFGRYGGALAGVRPDDLAAHVVRELVARVAGARPERDRRRHVRRRQPGRARTTATSRAWRSLLAGLPTSVPGTTVNRLCGSSLDAAMQASRAIETGDASLVARRRRRVDVARAGRAAQAGEGVRRRRADAALDDARLADGQPADARRVDDLARRRHGEARRASTAVGREAQDEFALRSHRLTAAAWDAGFYDDWVVPGARHRARARRERAPRHVGSRSWRSSSRRSRDGRHRHRRQRVAAQRRRRRAARSATRRPARRWGASRWRGSPAAARTPSTRTSSASRRSRRPTRRCARAGHRLGRRRGGRAQRGVRGAVAGLPRRVEGARSRARQRQRRRDRDRAPARGVRRRASWRRWRTSCAAAAAATASPRSASASGRDWRWCCMREPALGLPGRTSRRPCGTRRSRWSTCREQVTETTGPQLGQLRAGDDRERPHDAPAAVGERITVSGRLLDVDGRPIRDSLVEIWQANAAGRYRHRWDDTGRRRWTRTSAAAGAA